MTKRMLRDVLDERQESVEARDCEDGSEARIYLKRLEVPGKKSGEDRLVLETYKSGKKAFRIAVSDIEVERAHQEGGNGELASPILPI